MKDDRAINEIAKTFDVNEANSIGADKAKRFPKLFLSETGLKAVMQTADNAHYDSSSVWSFEIYSPKGNIYVGSINLTVRDFGREADRVGWNSHSIENYGEALSKSMRNITKKL